MSKYTIVEALQNIRPGAQWVWRGTSYEGLDWRDDPAQKPTQAELEAELATMEAEEPFRLLRIERNERLDEMDRHVIQLVTENLPVPQDLKDYLQALRDLPDTATPTLDATGDLDFSSVTFPDPPAAFPRKRNIPGGIRLPNTRPPGGPVTPQRP